MIERQLADKDLGIPHPVDQLHRGVLVAGVGLIEAPQKPIDRLGFFRGEALGQLGFEQIFVLQNAMVLTMGDIIETFIYRTGIQKARFDFTTAAGLFNGLVGMFLVLLADRIAKKMDLPGIF